MVYLLRRFAAFYIDNGIIFFVSTFVYVIKGKISGTAILEIDNPNINELLIYHIVIAYLYFIISEYVFLKTIGKIIFKLKITGYNLISWKKRLQQATLRNLVRLFPFDPFSIFLDKEKRMWHDLISKTKVIDVRKKGIK